MIAVDTWEQREGVSERYARYRHENNYNRVLERFDGRPIEVMRMLTSEAAKLVPDGSLDFAFVDASHEYESVAQDIDDWLPKVRSMLLGHDWLNPDVKRAVTERFKDIITGPDQCWAVKV